MEIKQLADCVKITLDNVVGVTVKAWESSTTPVELVITDNQVAELLIKLREHVTNNLNK